MSAPATEPAPQASEPSPASAAWSPRARRVELALWAALALLVVAAYFYHLGRNPPGLWIDETAIGYNARCIARTGADEYGTRWPLFFRSFEDYKSPLLVYSAALTVGVLGTTPFAVRLAAALFALGSGVAFFFLLRRITGRERLARWLVLLALLAPSTFCFGRHVVTEACTVGLMLALAFLALERWQEVPSLRRAALAGGMLGLCAYAYTTQRLFAPLMIAVAGLSFLIDPRTRRTIWAFAATAAAVLAPYAIYLLVLHPGALTKRFDEISIFRDHATWAVAARRFAGHYVEHAFGLDFLFRTGDPNIRHSPGIGFLPIWMALPVLLGIAVLWRRRKTTMARFYLALLPLVPIPVAMTHADSPHASRMLHLFPLLLVACALAAAEFIERARPSRALLVVLACAAFFESGAFLYRYFVDYPAQAEQAFDGGEGEALRIALAARRPGERIFAGSDFFCFDGTRLKYFGDLDAAQSREGGGLARLGFSEGGAGTVIPPGSIAILPGAATPLRAERFDRLGVSNSERDGKPLWTVYRVNP